jgi:hypothetical protein
MSHKTRDLAFMAAAKKSVQSPSDLGTPLYDWWRAYDMGYSDGQGVGAWVGHVNGVTVSQGSSGLQPVFKTGIINGQPVSRMEPVNDDYLFFPADLLAKTDLALIIVCKNIGLGGTSGSNFMTSIAAAKGYWGIDGAKFMKVKNTAGTVYTSGTALAAAINAANMLAVIITGGNIKFYEKKTLLSTVAHAADFQIGKFGDFGPIDIDVDLADVVIVDGVLTEADLFALYDGYFQPTYAL